MLKKDGMKSAEARRERKIFKEEILKRMKENDWNEVIDNLIARAKKNSKDFEVLRDTIGQKPKETEEHEVKLPIFNFEVVDNKGLEKYFFEMEEKD